MRHLRLAALAAALAVLIGTLAGPRPVAADYLYVSDGDGIWSGAFGWDVCDDAAWSHTYQLWYLLNDSPQVNLTWGSSVVIDLEPTVVGTLNGSVTLTGATTISDTIPASNLTLPGVPEQSRLGAPAVFVLTFTPGTPTVGELPVSDYLAERFGPEYPGFAAVRATITTALPVPNTAMATDAGAATGAAERTSQQTVVMEAQAFKTCGTPEPTPGQTPEPTLTTPTPTADSSASPDTLTADRGDAGVAPAVSIVLATSLLMLGVVNGRALRRRR